MGKPWITNDTFTAASPWGAPAVPSKPQFDETDDNKKLYGIELAKGLTPYEAAKVVFPVANGACVWVAQNWLSDPLVNAAKDQYLQGISVTSKLLDKEALAVKVMAFVDEKWTTQSGVQLYVNEGKERLAGLALYAKIIGAIDNKTEVNLNNTVNNTNNFMSIKLVKAEVKDAQPLNAPNTQSKILNNEAALPQLKLVGGAG